MKLDNSTPMTNADALFLVDELSCYWSKFSGIKKKFNRAMFSDGLSNIKKSAPSGAQEIEQVTLSKAYDPDRDGPVLDFLQSHECGEPFSMTVRPVKRCGQMEFRGKSAWSLSGCRVSEWSVFELMDTGSGDSVVELKMVFSVDQVSIAGNSNSITSPSNL
jgi:hypothetical protein